MTAKGKNFPKTPLSPLTMGCEEQTDEPNPPRKLPERAGSGFPRCPETQKGSWSSKQIISWVGTSNPAEAVPCSKAEKPQADPSAVLTGLGLRQAGVRMCRHGSRGGYFSSSSSSEAGPGALSWCYEKIAGRFTILNCLLSR